MKEATPMMSQYKALKAKHQDAILLFRLGDFYEMFYEDAEVGSRELGIALTGRDAGKGQRAPMCGVPYHAVDDYIRILIDKGYKVAICDQMEDPALAKGLVKREITRVITPGTYWEGTEAGTVSYIASVFCGGDKGAELFSSKHRGAGARLSEGLRTLPPGEVGISACDLSTGEVLVAVFQTDPDGDSAKEKALEELSRLMPKECLVPEGGKDLAKAIARTVPGVFLTEVPRESFGRSDGESVPEAWQTGTGRDEDLDEAALEGGHGPHGTLWPSVLETYGESTIVEFKSSRKTPALFALEGLLSYLISTQMTDLSQLKAPVFYLEADFMEIDRSTRRNLELFHRLQGGKEGSLYWVLNKACTSMGSRLLEQWMERPLKDPAKVQVRLDAVETIFKDAALRERLRDELGKIKDLERLVTKIAYRSCNARDLVALASSLETVPNLLKVLSSTEDAGGQGHMASSGGSNPRPKPLLEDIGMRLDPVPEVVKLIRDAIVPDPPLSVTDGYLVREGYSESVDSLRDAASGGKRWIQEFEAKERETTGIKNLKVGYNRVFGYYIEVSKSNLSSVPSHYVRKQTLSTGERYVTPELRERETAILGAEEKLFKEEYQIFCQVRDEVSSYVRRIQETARAVAELDVIACLAEIAAVNGYVKPTISEDGCFVIRGGRHPVLEKMLPPGEYVPNDLRLDRDKRMLIITGPNMGGKSTYCRQVALIALMAQMGSFVPARYCQISCLDKLFARVGAYDDLVLGQSTFMVEMSEVARIVSRATSQSLVILDEIGRGTSTFDGLAVAWAVLEHLCGSGSGENYVAGPMTLVATHYRELTLLADLKPAVANFNVSVKKSGHQVLFLRRVIPGVAESSFGIEVAAMAGLPPDVVKRAKEVLLVLEAEARRGAKWKTGILGQVASRGASALSALEGIVPGQASLFSPTSDIGEGAQMSGPPTPPVPPQVSEIAWEIEALDLDNMSPLEALQELYELKKHLKLGQTHGDASPSQDKDPGREE